MTAPGTQVDIAPTLLGLAGIQAPSTMDGRSIVPFLVDAHGADLLDSTRKHLAEIGDLGAYQDNWRQEVFIEYYFVDENIKCTADCEKGTYPLKDANCVDLANNADCWCKGQAGTTDPNCYATETRANNFIALRRFDADGTVYVEYQSGDDITSD